MTDAAGPWSAPEMQRAIQRIEASALRIERTLASDYVRRDVYESDRRGLDEWKREVATDLVNLEADATRTRRDHRTDIDAIRTGQRWAIGLSVSAAGVMVGVITYITNTVGLGG